MRFTVKERQAGHTDNMESSLLGFIESIKIEIAEALEGTVLR